MVQDSKAANGVNWLEASGLPHIFRTLGFAAQPAKLGLALAAILLTVLLGVLLDGAWKLAGRGVSEDAIFEFIRSRQSGLPVGATTGDRGVFSSFRQFEQQAIQGTLHAVVPELSLAGAVHGCRNMVYGLWWLVQEHILFALLFLVGSLLIWSAFGGAMCRMTAMHFARDDRLSLREAMSFAREKLFGGLFLAPCIPLAFIVITGVLMILGGMLLRLGLLGDVVCGILFFLALIGGFVITVLLLGLVIGGPLMWPAVAAEGSDAFDAFSRSLSYPFSKPWKTVLYGGLMFAYAGVCWLFVSFFAALALRITHEVVSFGTSPFGWWSRGAEGEALTKLDLLWPMAGPYSLYAAPTWERLAWYEHVSAFLIGINVLLVIGLTWSFLASFFYSGSTVLYFLLRRDVDGIDLEDVSAPETGGAPFTSPPAATSAGSSSTGPTPDDATGAPAPSPG